MKLLIRYGAYPLIAGGAYVLLNLMANAGLAYWPLFPMVSIAGVVAVALLERQQPFRAAWREDHDGDTRVDLLHLLVSYALIQSAVAICFGPRRHFPDWPAFWPDTAPMALQILLAGLIFDLGLYLMHRASHVSGLLWRLHALHHSPRRLYWLNGGRRHPLSALALALPGLGVLLGLGATPIALGAWLSFMSVHLAFQHANLDYRLGPLRRLFAVAEMHRWHHKRDFEDAQVNFGEVLLVWDWLLGSGFDAAGAPSDGAVGLHGPTPKERYLDQLRWPFQTALWKERS